MVSLTSETTKFVDICPEWALVENAAKLAQKGNSPQPVEGHRAGEVQRKIVGPHFETKLGAALQTGTIARTDLQSTPLDPSWILEGNPIARSLPLGESPDGNLTFGLWDCTEGQFVFKYRSDEIVHILEGEATVRGAGMEVHLRPGVVAFFPKGSTLHWNVRSPIKKLWIFRSTEQGLLGRITGKLKRLWQNMTRENGRTKGETSAGTNFPGSP